MLRRFTACLTAIVVYAFTVFSPALDMARASQNALLSPTTGSVSGLSLTNNYNSALDSLNTCNSGASAPTNQLSGVPSLGNCWINTSTTPNTYNIYDGTDWLPVAYLDIVNHIWVPILGGGEVGSLTAASTTNLCPSTTGSTVVSFVQITGTTTINSFGTNCAVGSIKIVLFNSATPLTNSGNIYPPTFADYTTAATDIGIFAYAGANWYPVSYLKGNGSALSTVGLNIGASALGNSALAFTVPTNLQLNASIASDELTVAVCTTNSGSNTCNNASSTNPILFSFPDPANLYYGDPVIVSLQAAQSFTTGATSDSFGCATGVLCKLWVWEINNGGTLGVCVYNTVSGNNILDLNETLNQTSQSGTGGGANAQNLYCNISAVSAKAVRRLGYIEATWTSGTGWTGITAVRLFGPGVHKPGEPAGNSGMGASITPFDATDLVHVIATGYNAGTNSSSAGVYTNLSTLKRGSTSIATQDSSGNYPVSGTLDLPFGFGILDNPATTSSTTYSVTCSNGTFTCTPTAAFLLEEITSWLETPANDDGKLRSVG
jgi:hypothetical protein